MKVFTILALLIAILAVIFATQNAAPVAIHFLSWNYEASMALVVIPIFSLGVLMGLLVSFPPTVRRMRKISNLKKVIEERNYTIQDLEKKLVEVNSPPSSIELSSDSDRPSSPATKFFKFPPHQ